MKTTSLLLSAFIFVFFIACGGGSSIEADPEPISEKTFSLWVMQENKCDDLKGVMNATVLIYLESPSLNPEADFNTYTTGENGLIELDLESGSQVSFTVIASAELEFGKVNIVRSFIDVDVDNYVVPMFNGSYALDDDTCECQSATITAEITPLDDPDEFVTFAFLDWNRLRDSYISWGSDGASSNINAREICGEDSDSPLVFSVQTAVGCADCVIDVKYGILEKPTIEKLNEIIPLNRISETVPKPEYLEDYNVTHARYLDRTFYLKEASYWGISTLDEIDIGQHYYSLSQVVEGSYNDQSQVGVIYRRSYQDSSDMAIIGEAPQASPMAINYNEEEKSYTITAQGSEDYDFKYFHTSFFDEDYNSTLWGIYSPNIETAFVPKLTAVMEQLIASSTPSTQVFRITDTDDVSDYSAALKKTVLKRSGFGGVSRKSYDMRFRNENLKSNAAIHKMLERLGDDDEEH